jgi:hypothetical protein
VNIWRKLNPRRRWVKRQLGDEINAAVSAAFPTPYSIDEILLQNRRKETDTASNTIYRELSSDSSGTSSNKKDTSKSFNFDTSSNKWVGAEAAALYGAGIYEKYQAIDAHVYQTMSNLAGQHIDNLSELSQRFQTNWDYDFWSHRISGVNKMAGHLAEPYAAEHFEHAGHQVVWPEFSNQQGWDFIVDGHDVNVKLVTDVGSLAKHFHDYPDIPAVVPADLDLGKFADSAFHFDPANSIHGALTDFLASHDAHKIIVDQALSTAAIKDQALDSADVALGGAGAFHAHIPIITIATVSWREGRLLYTSKTDWESASKNLASDVVGRGGGAFIGAKAGAVIGATIGSVFPGAGTAIGGAVGGVSGAIGGAIAGGKGSNKIKRLALKKVVGSAKLAESDLRASQAELQKKGDAKFARENDNQSDKLKNARGIEKSKISQAFNRIQQGQEIQSKITYMKFREWMVEAHNEIQANINNTENELKLYDLWRRYLWPNEQVVVLEEIVALLEIKSKKVVVDSEKLIQGNSTIQSSSVMKLFADAGILRDRVAEYINQIEQSRCKYEAEYRAQIETSYGEIIKQRKQAFSVLSELVNKMSAHIRESLAPKLKYLEMQIESVNVEKAKLGLA